MRSRTDSWDIPHKISQNDDEIPLNSSYCHLEVAFDSLKGQSKRIPHGLRCQKLITQIKEKSYCIFLSSIGKVTSLM